MLWMTGRFIGSEDAEGVEGERGELEGKRGGHVILVGGEVGRGGGGECVGERDGEEGSGVSAGGCEDVRSEED